MVTRMVSAFIRALEKVLGDDVNDHVITYVDDLIIHSSTFQEHLEHLDHVLIRLLQQGSPFGSHAGNRLRGEFNKRQLRVYRESGDQTHT
jgi:hypothetical protein